MAATAAQNGYLQEDTLYEPMEMFPERISKSNQTRTTIAQASPLLSKKNRLKAPHAALGGGRGGGEEAEKRPGNPNPNRKKIILAY